MLDRKYTTTEDLERSVASSDLPSRIARYKKDHYFPHSVEDDLGYTIDLGKNTTTAALEEYMHGRLWQQLTEDERLQVMRYVRAIDTSKSGWSVYHNTPGMNLFGLPDRARTIPPDAQDFGVVSGWFVADMVDSGHLALRVMPSTAARLVWNWCHGWPGM